MKKISIDNGHLFFEASEVINEIMELNLWDALVNYMDDDTREQVHSEIAPCTELEFLTRYLEVAPYDLVIG